MLCKSSIIGSRAYRSSSRFSAGPIQLPVGSGPTDWNVSLMVFTTQSYLRSNSWGKMPITCEETYMDAFWALFPSMEARARVKTLRGQSNPKTTAFLKSVDDCTPLEITAIPKHLPVGHVAIIEDVNLRWMQALGTTWNIDPCTLLSTLTGKESRLTSGKRCLAHHLPIRRGLGHISVTLRLTMWVPTLLCRLVIHTGTWMA